MPVYNAGKLLREAIESILVQDEPDFEFLIIDDCSKDRSSAVIRSYAARDPRIRTFFHRKNAGLAATLNEGLREARSELVARMDADDLALPNRLSTQIHFLRARQQVAVAGSFVYHIGRTPEWDHLIHLPVEHAEISEILPKRNCMYHPSVMMRRAPILDLGGYRLDFRHAEDYDLWLRTSRRYHLANIPAPLLRYRLSAGGESLRERWTQALYAQMAIVSYGFPEWPMEQVRKQAGLELEKMGKSTFLQAVALATVEELLNLGQEKDAYRVWWKFFRQLDFRAKQKALSSGWELYRRRKRQYQIASSR